MNLEDKFGKLPLLENKRITMRPVQLSDASDMFEYGSDEEVVKYLPWGPYKSIEEVRSGIENFFLKRPEAGLPLAYAVIWKETGKMIGTCDFHSIDKEENRGGIGFVLNRDFWNRGIITEAAALLIEAGRDYFGFSGITLDHRPENAAAARMAEKLGFRKIGIREHRFMAGQESRKMVHYRLDFS